MDHPETWGERFERMIESPVPHDSRYAFDWDEPRLDPWPEPKRDFTALIVAVELEAAYMAGWRDGLAWRRL